MEENDKNCVALNEVDQVDLFECADIIHDSWNISLTA